MHNVEKCINFSKYILKITINNNYTYKMSNFSMGKTTSMLDPYKAFGTAIQYVVYILCERRKTAMYNE